MAESDILLPRMVYGRIVSPFLSEQADSTYFVTDGHLTSKHDLRWLLAAFNSTIRFYGFQHPTFDPEDFLEYGYYQVAYTTIPETGGKLAAIDLRRVPTDGYDPCTFMEF